MAIPANRTFYTVGETGFYSYNLSEVQAHVQEYRDLGYNVSYETYTEAEAYGADHDPKMFTNPEAKKVNRAPKVGRRYGMRLR